MYQRLWLKIIRSETELFATADEQKKAEEKDLKSFPLSRSTKALSDLLENTWKMESTSKKFFRSKQTRMKVIYEHSHGRCMNSYSGDWLKRASEVLQENNIYPPYFSTVVLIIRQYRLKALPVAICSNWPD